MKLEEKLQEELNRYRAINKYTNKMIVEQEAPPVPPADAPPVPPADAPPVPPADAPPVPPADAPPVGAPPAPTSDTEEVDVTDLVNMTKNIKKDIDSNKAEHNNVITKMDDVFTKLTDLENKLSQMDSVIAKIDELGTKMENMKEPTPVEKLEMRSLDSFPFSQNPQQFFTEKQGQMKQSGKNEYVLTKDEIENYSKDTIKDSFNSNNENEFSV